MTPVTRAADTALEPAARPRRYVLAPDSFKGTITATQACAALAAGIRDSDPTAQIVHRPMADGGEGTLVAFETTITGAQRMPVRVTGPDGATVEATWVYIPAIGEGSRSLGVVELASTSGIELLTGRELLPLEAHTLGFGQAIRAAIEFGVEQLVLCIGSSASSDGGAGMLTALGARLVGRDGADAGLGVAGLERVVAVDTGRMLRLPPGRAIVITDVHSPLTGPDGAAHVFGAQKGASPDQIARIDRALARWAGIVGGDSAAPGAGAAGGTGLALMAWGATLTPGADAIAELIGVAESLASADVVVTGEGSYDEQSSGAKVPAVIRSLARRAGVPTVLVAGRIAPAPSRFDLEISLSELASSTSAAMTRASYWLREAGGALASAPLGPASHVPFVRPT